MAEFLERGLAQQTLLGHVVITTRGQLELARCRYIRLRNSGHAVLDDEPKRPFWWRLFR